MAFPSVLIFHDVPESIDYEMTLKHSPDVIKGKKKLLSSNQIPFYYQLYY